jgi:predicted acyltransferase
MKIAAITTVVVLCAGAAYLAALIVRRAPRIYMIAVAVLLAASYVVILITRPSPVPVGGLLGAIASSLVGALFGAYVVSNLPGLVAFLVTASALDILSVRSGPTKALFDTASGGDGLVYYLVVLLPWEEGFIPVIGVGDLFGLAVIFAALLGMGAGKGMTSLCGLSGILLALAAGLLLGGVPAYPLLAALAVPLAVWTERRKRVETVRSND